MRLIVFTARLSRSSAPALHCSPRSPARTASPGVPAEVIVSLVYTSPLLTHVCVEQNSPLGCQVTPAHANRGSAGLSGTDSPIRRRCAKQLYLVAVCKHRDAFGRRRRRRQRIEPHYSTPAGTLSITGSGVTCLQPIMAISISTSAPSIHRSRQPRPLQP
jgi:hypothetical protein